MHLILFRFLVFALLQLLRALTATQSHSPSQSDPQSLFSFRSTGLGAGDANADADAEVNSPPPSGEEGFREAVPEDDREVNGDAGAGEETHTHDTVSIAQTQSHKQSHAQHTLQLRPVDREAVRGLVQQYKRDVEALGRVRRCFLMRSQLLGQQQQLAEAGSEAVTGELSEQQQQQQEQEQQGLSGGDASTSRYGCNRNNRGRGTGVSPPLIPEGRTAAADTDMASASGSASVKNSHHREPNKRRSDGGSTSRSSSGKLLDLSEVAPQSMINMAHPALRGSAVAAAASSGEAGLGFSLSHKHDPKQQMEVQCKLPAPPLHHSPVHPTLLPRKGSSSSGGGGECTTSRDSLSPTACVGGSGGGAGIITSPPVYQQSTHTGNSNGYGNSRVVKSLRLTGPPPSASSRTEPHQHATCGVIGGLGRAHLGSSNEHSKALNPNSVPHSVFRAFQQQEQQGHSSNGLSGRSSPDRSLLLVHRSMPGGALVGSGTQQQQQKRRALKAGNVLSSMSGTSSTHKSQTESNKSDANMFI